MLWSVVYNVTCAKPVQPSRTRQHTQRLLLTAAEPPVEPATPPVLARLPLGAGSLQAVTARLNKFIAAKEHHLAAVADIPTPAKISTAMQQLDLQWQLSLPLPSLSLPLCFCCKRSSLFTSLAPFRPDTVFCMSTCSSQPWTCQNMHQKSGRRRDPRTQLYCCQQA